MKHSIKNSTKESSAASDAVEPAQSAPATPVDIHELREIVHEFWDNYNLASRWLFLFQNALVANSSALDGRREEDKMQLATLFLTCWEIVRIVEYGLKEGKTKLTCTELENIVAELASDSGQNTSYFGAGVRGVLIELTLNSLYVGSQSIYHTTSTGLNAFQVSNLFERLMDAMAAGSPNNPHTEIDY